MKIEILSIAVNVICTVVNLVAGEHWKAVYWAGGVIISVSLYKMRG